MKLLLWVVCCITAFLSYMVLHLNKENAKLQEEKFALVNSLALCANQDAVCQENLNRYYIAFRTIKKKYPKLHLQYDLLINGIDK